MLTRLTAFLLLMSALGFGCKTTEKPGSDSLAAVQIHGVDSLAIARAISSTFQEAGFAPVPLPRTRDSRLMFEKRGTKTDTVLYGDWSFKQVWYRTKIKIQKLDRETLLVTCDAFRVLNHGDKHFEEEQRLKSAKRGQFQSLLERAKTVAQTSTTQPSTSIGEQRQQ